MHQVLNFLVSRLTHRSLSLRLVNNELASQIDELRAVGCAASAVSWPHSKRKPKVAKQCVNSAVNIDPTLYLEREGLRARTIIELVYSFVTRKLKMIKRRVNNAARSELCMYLER